MNAIMQFGIKDFKRYLKANGIKGHLKNVAVKRYKERVHLALVAKLKELEDDKNTKED